MQKYFKLMPVTSENNTNQIICSVTQEGSEKEWLNDLFIPDI